MVSGRSVRSLFWARHSRSWSGKPARSRAHILLAFGANHAHRDGLDPISTGDDFSVVVKLRGRPPHPWRWEMYRAGRSSPIVQSDGFFETASMANKAGQKALKLFLSECPPE
jgi:hypothetical protein